jgi:dihydroflavonol-4-reductase
VRAAVTGGSGVVGRAVVRHLVEAGHEVAALAHSEASAEHLVRTGASTVPGDVLDPLTLRDLVAGADIVFHIAGVNQICSPDPDHMDRVNIDGTRNVLAACREAGTQRMVHTSSAAAIGEAPGTIGSESSPHHGVYLSRYERSKHLSEKLVFAEAGGVEVIAVNPSSVQGPGRATGTGKLFLDVLAGRLPFLVDTYVSIVDIDDCARGHLLAAENGVAGERYLLSGAGLDMRSAMALLAEVTGRDLRPRFIPGWVAAVAAGAVELAEKARGRRPRVCREMIHVLRAGHRYDGTRATRELGLGYTPIEVTIHRTVEWFRREGLLV